MEIITKVKALVEPILKELNLHLYQAVYEKEGQENFLRIFIEKDDMSMDLDTCVLVSEKVSALLDQHDFIKEDYMLEVASPGIERVLSGKEEYLKALEKYILVVTSQPILGYEELVGYLKEVNDEKIKLQINLKGRLKVVEIPFNIISKAHLSFKF